MTNPCPKCGHENTPEQPECGRCGVIFAKIRTREAPVPPREDRDTGAAMAADDLLLALPPGDSPSLLWGRGAALLLMLAWGAALLLSGLESEAAGKGLLHLVNLPFHEAGHVLLRPLGQFVSSLGGTLGQLAIPLICLGVLLLKNRDPFGAAVCLWWLGENLIDIAPYINDARAGEMPLLGGNFGHSSPYGFHDWEYLLTETGLLQHDHRLALLSHVSGALLMALAVIWGVLLFRGQYKAANGGGKGPERGKETY
jgi:hypothetical protein